MTITINDIERAKELLMQWRKNAEVRGKNLNNFDHLIRVITELCEEVLL